MKYSKQPVLYRETAGEAAGFLFVYSAFGCFFTVGGDKGGSVGVLKGGVWNMQLLRFQILGRDQTNGWREGFKNNPVYAILQIQRKASIKKTFQQFLKGVVSLCVSLSLSLPLGLCLSTQGYSESHDKTHLQSFLEHRTKESGRCFFSFLIPSGVSGPGDPSLHSPSSRRGFATDFVSWKRESSPASPQLSWRPDLKLTVSAAGEKTFFGNWQAGEEELLPRRPPWRRFQMGERRIIHTCLQARKKFAGKKP